MSGRRLFLGIDGGGTKTTFVCIDGDRQIVAATAEGTTYHLQIGLDAVVAVIRQGVATICGELGTTPLGLENIFFGLPAFGEDAVIDPQLEQACRSLLGHDRYSCGNDMICGWAGSLGCEDGINLVAGTGSIGYGERQGSTARVGGWGEVFGDEGSAYWIALQGLNAFTRMSDGRLPIGPLHASLRRAFGLSSDLDICARVMGTSEMARDELADLARIVSDAADGGDTVARQILRRAGLELADMAVALRNTLGFTENESALLSWSGGVLSNQEIVRDALLEGLGTDRPFTLIAPRYEPGYGAALYAYKSAQLASGESVSHRPLRR